MLPLVVIGVSALGLGWLVSRRTPPAPLPGAVGSAPKQSVSAPITSRVPSSGNPFIPSVFQGFTNRPTGPLVGALRREELPEGPSGGDLALAQAKQIIGYIKLAVGAVVEAGKQIGSQIASQVGSVVPIVGAVIGVGTGAAGLAQGSKDEGISEATSFVSAIPLVGLVALPVTLVRLFEGLNEAEHTKTDIKEAKADYAKALSDAASWLPRAVAVSDRLDEWMLLPRTTLAQQLAWVTEVNGLAKDLIQAFPQTIQFAINHLKLGESVGPGIVMIPSRDTTVMETTFGRGLMDAYILQMATADFLSRHGRPYKQSEFASGDYFLLHTAGMAGIAHQSVQGVAGWTPTWDDPGLGVIPGLHAPLVEGQINWRDVPVAPSLQAIAARLRPPHWLHTFMQYWEAVDVYRFRGSPIYGRIAQTRVIQVLDELAPTTVILPASQTSEEIHQEIAAVVAAVQVAQEQDAAYFEFLRLQQQQTFSAP